MSKEEILQALRASRQINTMEDTANWREAFAQYNVATGSRLSAKSRCQKCFSKVVEWLQQ